MMKITTYFTDEELDDLKKMGPEFLESLELQQKSRLYKDANFLYNRTQYKQMVKAADKYTEPLNPDSWTVDELIDHAFEELVDQSHYLTGLLLKTRKMEIELKAMKDNALYWRDKYQELQGELLK